MSEKKHMMAIVINLFSYSGLNCLMSDFLLFDFAVEFTIYGQHFSLWCLVTIMMIIIITSSSSSHSQQKCILFTTWIQVGNG